MFLTEEKYVLRIILIVGTVLSSAAQIYSSWAPLGYFLGNLLFLVSLILAISLDERPDALWLSFATLIVSWFVDAIVIGLKYDDLQLTDSSGSSSSVVNSNRFMVGMAILWLLFKIPAAIALFKFYADRCGQGIMNAMIPGQRADIRAQQNQPAAEKSGGDSEIVGIDTQHQPPTYEDNTGKTVY